MGTKLISNLFKTADDLLEELGYEWYKLGNKGCGYEKLMGREEPHDIPVVKIIEFEKTDDGDYIFMCCNREGTAGQGHQGAWLTYPELKACCKKVKELKRNR